MSRIFLSHSSRNTREAIALKRWLATQDRTLAEEIFLDVDPDTGIPTGARWRDALHAASTRCEAVICLLSADWASSAECRLEYDSAVALHKRIFCARLEESPADELTAQFQRCDLFGDGQVTSVAAVGKSDPVAFSSDGLYRLLKGIRGAGLSAESFHWPPERDPDRAPYRGWEPLTEADAAVFFGRDAEIVLGLDALRGMRRGLAQSLFVVLGPSGAGKSSFLRAGLLPRLRREDRAFTVLGIVRPERAVLSGKSGLARSIHETRRRLGLSEPSLEEIAATCLTDPARVRALLVGCRAAAERRIVDREPAEESPTLVLPLDQAEELFTADAGPETAQFLALLTMLADPTDGIGLVVAATIRTDRYEAMQTAPALDGLNTLLFDNLKPMPPNHFKEVIEGPAKRASAAGHRLTVDAALVSRLLVDSTEGADTLPILSLTLAWLFERHGASGRLTVEQYNAMGGMRRVVQNEINSVLSADPQRRRYELDQLRSAFIPWLATINPDNDQPMRRIARYVDLPEPSRPLIDRLIGKRLMVSDVQVHGEVTVEVALESLLRQWDDLATWLRDQRHNLKSADDLERGADGWRAAGLDAAWLLAGARLADAEGLANSPVFRQRLLNTHEFLWASREAENKRQWTEEQRRQAEVNAAREKQATAEAHSTTLRRRSRILRAVLAGTAVVAIVAVVGLVLATIARNQAETRFRQATALRLISDGTATLGGTVPGPDTKAFQQLLVAQSLSDAPRDDGVLFGAQVMRFDTAKIVDTGSPVNALAVSPDGKRVATANRDGTITLWDPATGQPSGDAITGHDGAVTSIAFSPNGRTVATGGADATVRLWDADAHKPIGRPLRGNQALIQSLTFSPDGEVLASGAGDGWVHVWTADGSRHKGKFLGVSDGGAVNGLAYSPDSLLLAIAGQDGGVRLVNIVSGELRYPPLQGDAGAMTAVRFTRDGRRLITGGDDGTVRVWDAARGQAVGEPLRGHTDFVADVAVSPDGELIASAGGDQQILLWRTETGERLPNPLVGHQGFVTTLAFSPDGERLFSGSDDHSLRSWRPELGQPIRAHDGVVLTATFSPDGMSVASAGEDGAVRLWNPLDGAPIGAPLLGGEHLFALTYRPDGTQLAAGGADDVIRLWDPTTGRLVMAPLVGHGNSVTDVAYSPDGGTIASASKDGTVRRWNADTGAPVGDALGGHDGYVWSITYSPDGSRIASVGADGTIRQWDATSGEQIGAPIDAEQGALFGIAISPDGKYLASAGDDHSIRLWDVASGRPAGNHLDGNRNSVGAATFSPDGRHLASSGADGTIRLWDVSDHREVGGPIDVGTPTMSVAFSPDGELLASAQQDGTVRVWPARPDQDLLCDKMTENMSAQEWAAWVSPDIDYSPPCPDLPIRPNDP